MIDSLPLRNAGHDVFRTLTVLPNCLSRLLYLRSLRDQAGNYQHWGLTAEYGQERTRTAFEEAHRTAYQQFLQSEVSDLISFFREHCETSVRDCPSMILEFACDEAFRPADVPEHSVTHFNCVLGLLLAQCGTECRWRKQPTSEVG